VKVAITESLGRERQVYSHFELKLHLFKARCMSGRLHAQAGEAVQWLALDALDTVPFDNASRRVLNRLLL
jgi:adenine-specific DNA glycosylase